MNQKDIDEIKQAIIDAFTSSMPTIRRTAILSQDDSDAGKIETNKSGNASRDDKGRFKSMNDVFNQFDGSMRDYIASLNQSSKKITNQISENQHAIEEVERRYMSMKSSLTKEEQEEYESQIKIEKALLIDRQKALADHNEALRKIKLKQIQYQNEEIAFEAKHLEKRISISQARQKAENAYEEEHNKGYDDDGKRKDSSEWHDMIGEFKKTLTGNTKGRNISTGIAAVGNGVASGMKFLGSDQSVSISNVGNGIATLVDKIPAVGKVLGSLVRVATAGVEALDKINKAGSEYARTVGGGAAKMEAMKRDAVSIATSISTWGGNAYDFQEIMENIAEISTATGRQMDHMSQKDTKSLLDMKKFGITSDILNQYDTFGLSMEQIDKRVLSIYQTSGKHGLNAKAVTDTVNKNLKMAQQYTFAGGQKALARMAEKSVALKYNMESVSRFAEKVSTLEGAATSAAQLSVLGGDFARMGNPLTMLYGGLQDAEKLNDMMLNMTKNMASWDEENGEMRISAYNRQRLKAAADAIGVDSSELINQALMQGKRTRIDEQLNTTGKINDEDTREYIKNIAQLDEKGKAYVKFHGTNETKYLEDLTPEDKQKLKEESELMSEKQAAGMGDVWQETRTIQEKLDDLIKWLKNNFFEIIMKIVDFVEGIYNWTVGAIKDVGNFFSDAANAVGDFFSDGWNHGWGLWSEGGKIEGPGTSTSDSIPARLSNGEFVVNAAATEKYLPLLERMNNNGIQGFAKGTQEPINISNATSEFGSFSSNTSDDIFKLKQGLFKDNNNNTFIQPSDKQFNQLSVNKIEPTNTGVGQQKFSFEPLTINVTGTIRLDGAGISKDFDASKLLGNDFINKIMREIEVATNRSLDRNKLVMKYPSGSSFSGIA